MLLVPGDDAVEAVEFVLFFMEAVIFARILDKLGRRTIKLEPAIEAGTLAERVSGVGLALKDQDGRVGVLQIEIRRVLEHVF